MMVKLSLYQGDCLKALIKIPSESVDLIVTSPPYNVGIDYGVYKDNLSFPEYYSWVKDWLSECYRVSKVGGRICVNISSCFNKAQKFETFIDKYITLLTETGYINREIITWFKVKRENDIENSCCHGKTSWGSWMSASNPYCRSYTEFILVAHKIEPKIQHKGVSDITREEFLKFTRDYWAMQTDYSDTHPAIFPEELPYRCIRLYSYIGDTVLDPFLGSGTTMKVARKLGRDCIGIEIDPDNIKAVKAKVNFGSTLEDVEFQFTSLG
jgi:site-specific DNA-methyltransferase (adenine-specific)